MKIKDSTTIPYKDINPDPEEMQKHFQGLKKPGLIIDENIKNFLSKNPTSDFVVLHEIDSGEEIIVNKNSICCVKKTDRGSLVYINNYNIEVKEVDFL